MKRRTIVPQFFFRNPELAALSAHARLLLAGLWCIADREGRAIYQPSEIHADVFPYEPHLKIEELFQELSSAGFIRVYSVENHHYLDIPNFKQQQYIHANAAKSKIPGIESAHQFPVITSNAQKLLVTHRPQSNSAPQQAKQDTPVKQSVHENSANGGTSRGVFSSSSLLKSRKNVVQMSLLGTEDEEVFFLDKRSQGTLDGFEEFWNAYDHKKNRKRCEQLWREMKLAQIADTIISDVRRRAKFDRRWRPSEGKPKGYRLDPERYLKREGWTDDIEEVRTSATEHREGW